MVKQLLNFLWKEKKDASGIKISKPNLVSIFVMFVGLANYTFADESSIPVYDLEWETPRAEKILVGDPAKLFIVGIDARNLAQETMALKSSIELDEAQSWYVRSISVLDSNRIQVIIVALSSGLIEVPELILRKSDGTELARTKSFNFQVESVFQQPGVKKEPPPDALAPLKIEFPSELKLIIIILSSLVGIILLAGLIVWVKKIRQNRPRSGEIKVKLTEGQVAINGLNKLRAQRHLRKSEYKRIYFSASELVKIYLGRRFRFDAPEATTEELVAELEKLAVSVRILGDVSALFEQLDRVKFTDYVPSDSAIDKMFDLAIEVVNKTRKRL